MDVPTRLDKSFLKIHRRQTIVRQRHYRTQLCKFHLNKSCTRGDACTYSHDLKMFPCKAFHVRKNCRRKNCPFSHEPLCEEDLNKLLEDEHPDKIILFSPLEDFKNINQVDNFNKG
ncbi:Zinc finger CCCH domain-containing protein 4 [Dictyocoela muelleri]|nr:Zinc finger CCCH domain-containing protein 4 [Dictyocoela muelleri]